MKNSSTLCLQAPKSSMNNLLKSTWKIQRENIKNLKLYLLDGDTSLKWLLLSFYKSKGSSVTIGVLFRH